jgi:hypothetical protein
VGRFLAALLLEVVIVCPPGAPQTLPTRPDRPVARGIGVFATQMVRPLYDSSAKSRLYISGYAGRRPAPPVMTPTGLRAPLGGRVLGQGPRGH